MHNTRIIALALLLDSELSAQCMLYIAAKKNSVTQCMRGLYYYTEEG